MKTKTRTKATVNTTAKTISLQVRVDVDTPKLHSPLESKNTTIDQ